MNFDDLRDIGIFFNWGQDLDAEIEHSVAAAILQPKRSLYFDREEGAGLVDRENYPNAVFLRIVGAFDIVNAITFLNSQVTDGRDSNPDRRVAISQTSINFRQNGGDLDVEALYIPLKDFGKSQSVSVPV